jgi:hypothetical protein
MTTTIKKSTKRFLLAALAASAVLAVPERADAQEILLTGPLAGAPAVRKLRLYRQGRFEIAPAVTFTLLDEYQRTIFLGARLQYNLTDWLGIGAWGSYGLIHMNTALTDHIQEVNGSPARTNGGYNNPERRLTAVNLGPNFEDQLGTMDWVVSPQITAVPFRGKLALFQGIYMDTDLYVFGGPAFIGLTERADCGGDDGQQPCAPGPNVEFEMASRTAIAPTFGFGLSFYINKWSAIGFEYRFLPFSMNTGGFDTAGGGQDEEYPDNKVTDADRGFAFRQLLTLSFNIFLPTQHRISE